MENHHTCSSHGIFSRIKNNRNIFAQLGNVLDVLLLFLDPCYFRSRMAHHVVLWVRFRHTSLLHLWWSNSLRGFYVQKNLESRQTTLQKKRDSFLKKNHTTRPPKCGSLCCIACIRDNDGDRDFRFYLSFLSGSVVILACIQNFFSSVYQCFVCGLTSTHIPQDAYCADAFAGDFLPLVPVDPRARGHIARYRKYCRYLDR